MTYYFSLGKLGPFFGLLAVLLSFSATSQDPSAPNGLDVFLNSFEDLELDLISRTPFTDSLKNPSQMVFMDKKRMLITERGLSGHYYTVWRVDKNAISPIIKRIPFGKAKDKYRPYYAYFQLHNRNLEMFHGNYTNYHSFSIDKDYDIALTGKIMQFSGRPYKMCYVDNRGFVGLLPDFGKEKLLATFDREGNPLEPSIKIPTIQMEGGEDNLKRYITIFQGRLLYSPKNDKLLYAGSLIPILQVYAVDEKMNLTMTNEIEQQFPISIEEEVFQCSAKAKRKVGFFNLMESTDSKTIYAECFEILDREPIKHYLIEFDWDINPVFKADLLGIKKVGSPMTIKGRILYIIDEENGDLVAYKITK